MNTIPQSKKKPAESVVVRVALNQHPYDVFIGSGIRALFANYFHEYGSGRSFWVTDSNVQKAWGAYLDEATTDSPAEIIVLHPGEEQKTLCTVERLCRQFSQLGVERGDTIIACGGGVIGDIVGFTAACYLRGISFVQIPTTLLAMVDASVGGKTGVDLPEGKNLVGTFHQPRFVLIDIDFLKTLSQRRLRDGYAEVLKTALIGSPTLFDILKKGGQAHLLQLDPELLIQTITTCVEFKARIVAQDERESDLRRILNFGHTVGHALEALGGYEQLSHGEAVLWGISAAIELSVEYKSLSAEFAAEINILLEPLLEQVPTLVFEPTEVYESILRDKKVRGGMPHFILLEDIGKPVITKEITKDQLFQVLANLKRRMQRL